VTGRKRIWPVENRVPIIPKDLFWETRASLE